MKRVVVAEDEASLAKLISFKLQREHYEVAMAEDGGKALELIQGGHPDLILLDVMMPVMDGYHVLQEIKKDPELSEIPVIMLTSKGQEKDVVRGIDLGATDYIVKPFRPSELVARIRRVLKE